MIKIATMVNFAPNSPEKQPFEKFIGTLKGTSGTSVKEAVF